MPGNLYHSPGDLGVFRNEAEFIRWLKRKSPGRADRLKLGIGDDAAVIEASRGHELILTTDLSIEGVHFLSSLHPPRSVGHRALARSLSDIAAMGGTARFALVSLAISKRTQRAWLEEVYAGMLALARRFGVRLIGGDTAVVHGKRFIDVIVVGEVPRGRALLRSGARPGDWIFVSRRLGVAAHGLMLLKSRRGRLRAGERRAVRAHLYPEPRLALGRFLAEKRLASALIDVSDGLSTDLGHLCEASGVGARVWANRIPGPNFAGEQSFALALHGGEDYALLFTVAPSKASRVPRTYRGVPLRRIGEITRSKKMVLVESSERVRPLEPAGYDHFRK